MAVLAVEPLVPGLSEHPATTPAVGGLALLVYIVTKALIERKWFNRSDRKTDDVGGRVDGVAAQVSKIGLAVDELKERSSERFDRIEERLSHRIDTLKDRVETLGDEMSGFRGTVEEQGRQAALVGRMMQRLEKAEKDLHVMHEWRRKLESKP